MPLLEGVSCELLRDGRGDNDSGRIRLKADFLMTGYVGAEADESVGLDADGWFVTSDVGQYDGQFLTVLGRADDVLLIGGKNVHPAEVEDRLTACPGVAIAYVLGLPDEMWGNSLGVAFEGGWEEGDLQQWCRDHLPNPYRPRIFQRFDALPRLSNGKLDKASMKMKLEALRNTGAQNGNVSSW